MDYDLIIEILIKAYKICGVIAMPFFVANAVKRHEKEEIERKKREM